MLTYSKKPVACFSVAFIYAALSVNWLWTLFNFIELVCLLRWALRLSSSSERKFFVCMALHFRDKWCAVCHTECYCSNCSCHDQLSRSSEIGRWNCCLQKEKSPKIFSVYWKITSRIVMCARKLREVFFFSVYFWWGTMNFACMITFLLVQAFNVAIEKKDWKADKQQLKKVGKSSSVLNLRLDKLSKTDHLLVTFIFLLVHIKW